jgi:hypothetical protein
VSIDDAVDKTDSLASKPPDDLLVIPDIADNRSEFLCANFDRDNLGIVDMVEYESRRSGFST